MRARPDTLAAEDQNDLHMSGLLCDDEYLCDASFRLGHTARSQSLYPFMRPAKRMRKHREARCEEDNPEVPFGLSFGSLYVDLVLAQLLVPENDEPLTAEDVATPYSQNDAFATARPDATLSMIDEHPETALPSPPPTPILT